MSGIHDRSKSPFGSDGACLHLVFIKTHSHSRNSHQEFPNVGLRPVSNPRMSLLSNVLSLISTKYLMSQSWVTFGVTPSALTTSLHHVKHKLLQQNNRQFYVKDHCRSVTYVQYIAEIKQTHNNQLFSKPQLVEQTQSFKYFGLEIDTSMSFSQHTDSVYNKAQQRLHLLRKLRDFQCLVRHFNCSLWVTNWIIFNISSWYKVLTTTHKAKLSGMNNWASKIIGSPQTFQSEWYTQSLIRKSHSDQAGPLSPPPSILPVTAVKSPSPFSDTLSQPSVLDTDA